MEISCRDENKNGDVYELIRIIRMRARIKIILTPLGDKIKFQVKGKIFCSRMNQELPNSRTLGKRDLVWRQIFESNNAIDRFLNRNKRISKIISLHALGYKDCDKILTFRLNKEDSC